MSNPFFNPDECPFEVLGFYEELLHPETGKMFGFRKLSEPTRKLGSDGRIEFEITEDLWLHKGKSMVILKASKAKPVRVCAMIQILCGRSKKGVAAFNAGTFYPQRITDRI